jgi:hypothetical protein
VNLMCDIGNHLSRIGWVQMSPLASTLS